MEIYILISKFAAKLKTKASEISPLTLIQEIPLFIFPMLTVLNNVNLIESTYKLTRLGTIYISKLLKCRPTLIFRTLPAISISTS